MANSYTFTADKTVTIGNATKKTDIDVVAANSDYLKEALDTIMSSSAADGVVTASGLAIDTTTLVVDAANNRVGIGTTSPEAPLHVLIADASVVPNTAADDLVVENTGSMGISLLTSNTGEGAIYFGDSDDNNAGLLSYSHVDNSFGFTVNGDSTASVVIDASGNVGIGTNTPTDLLTLKSPGSGNESLLVQENGSTQTVASILEDSSGQHGIMRLYDGANGIGCQLGGDGTMQITDGITAPSTTSGYAIIYVDTADGDLKVKFGDGHVAVIASDS